MALPLSAVCIRWLGTHVHEYEPESQAIISNILAHLEQQEPMLIANHLSSPAVVAGLCWCCPQVLDACRGSLARKPKTCTRILQALHGNLGDVPPDTLEAIENGMDLLNQTHRFKRDKVLPELGTAQRNTCRWVKKACAGMRSGPGRGRWEESRTNQTTAALRHQYKMSWLDNYTG
eukprot:TRINITY_DN28331_c0_g1_i2.p1 TRINITY_DN28331_c0_g1~~TRINITY_DN28331_c0_g1_i2.p1  ORF type:complete len:176 (+),score=17.08 TRINITY_DN28331_c0_g1_i2:209-736(+)